MQIDSQFDTGSQINGTVYGHIVPSVIKITLGTILELSIYLTGHTGQPLSNTLSEKKDFDTSEFMF